MRLVNQYKPQAQLRDLCRWAMLPRSLYYYNPTGGIKGIKPSNHTHKRDGSVVANELVVDDIKTILSGDFVCYGYHKVTMELRQMNYIINPKKVYRLMDQNHLLLGKVIKTQGKRKWVKHRKIEATKPLEYLCLDIKYVWIDGERRYYYLCWCQCC